MDDFHSTMGYNHNDTHKYSFLSFQVPTPEETALTGICHVCHRHETEEYQLDLSRPPMNERSRRKAGDMKKLPDADFQGGSQETLKFNEIIRIDKLKMHY
jgi:hypothetical protein